MVPSLAECFVCPGNPARSRVGFSAGMVGDVSPAPLSQAGMAPDTIDDDHGGAARSVCWRDYRKLENRRWREPSQYGRIFRPAAYCGCLFLVCPLSYGRWRTGEAISRALVACTGLNVQSSHYLSSIYIWIQPLRSRFNTSSP